MVRYLHTLSAVLFYLLGSGFFIAYILQLNNIAVPGYGTDFLFPSPYQYV